MSWEYRTLIVSGDGIDELNALGEEGWEGFGALPATWEGEFLYELTSTRLFLRRRR